MLKRATQILAVAAVATLGLSVAANAGCEGRRTTGTVVGGATGGVLGNVITHGSLVGTVAGAAVGGLAGHTIASNNCRGHYSHHRRGYYDRHHHWHYYASR